MSKEMVEMTEPYIPGFLAFREVEFLMNRLRVVEESNPHLTPQVTTVDNHHYSSFTLGNNGGWKWHTSSKR